MRAKLRAKLGHLFFALALTSPLHPVGATEVSPAPSRPELTPCKVGIYPPEALCGTYEVYENRASRSGRRIPLSLVLIPGASPQRSPDPFVFLPIEPGEGAVLRGLARYYELAPVRRKKDLLLVDLRGTGSSRPSI